MNTTLSSLGLVAFGFSFALLAFLASAVAGSVLAGSAGFFYTERRPRLFAEKLATQIALGVPALAVLALVACAGGLFGFKAMGLDLPSFAPLTLSGALLGAYFLLSLLAALTVAHFWRPKVLQKRGHTFLSLLAVILAGKAAGLCVLLANTDKEPVPLPGFAWTPEALQAALPSLGLDSPRLFEAVALGVEVMFFCLLSGTLVSFLNMLARRNKDDFGRDYYNFAMSHLGRLLRIGARLAVLGLGLYIGVHAQALLDSPMRNEAGAFFAAGLLFLVTCAGLGTKIQRSPTPMREKPALSAAFFLAFFALACQFMGFLSLYPFPAMTG